MYTGNILVLYMQREWTICGSLIASLTNSFWIVVYGIQVAWSFLGDTKVSCGFDSLLERLFS